MRVRLAGRDLEGHVGWSPDGKRIAITVDRQLAILDVDGDGSPRLIPNQPEKSTDVAWSHDGQWVAFASKGVVPVPKQAGTKKWQLVEAARHSRGTRFTAWRSLPTARSS